MAVIVTDKLGKQFGKIQALKEVSLAVERGEIFGLLGQNGAGKTTLIKILLGVISSSHGSANVLNHPAGTTRVRRQIGYLPEDHRFPEYHTGASLLDFYGSLLDVPHRVRRQRIPEVLEMVGLKARMHSKIRTYSKGMKQRVGIAQAMLHEPELIFLDEPTDGVDPVGRREIRELLERLKEQGITIFVNSHLLGEVELLCDRVGILQRGELLRCGDIATLTRQQGVFLLRLAEGEDLPLDDIKQLGFSADRDRERHLWEVQIGTGQSIDPVLELLHRKGLRLRHLVEKRQSLEDLFISMVDDQRQGKSTGREKKSRVEEGQRS
ncbi:MAG: ABC transporter ATP-binding protein [Gemmataceae bacterium]